MSWLLKTMRAYPVVIPLNEINNTLHYKMTKSNVKVVDSLNHR